MAYVVDLWIEIWAFGKFQMHFWTNLKSSPGESWNLLKELKTFFIKRGFDKGTFGSTDQYHTKGPWSSILSLFSTFFYTFVTFLHFLQVFFYSLTLLSTFSAFENFRKILTLFKLFSTCFHFLANSALFLYFLAL